MESEAEIRDMHGSSDKSGGSSIRQRQSLRQPLREWNLEAQLAVMIAVAVRPAYRKRLQPLRHLPLHETVHVA